MSVTEISFKPQDYSRANYFKREVLALVRYGEQHATEAKKQILVDAAYEAYVLVSGRLGLVATGFPKGP
jgi:hypothetical protein